MSLTNDRAQAASATRLTVLILGGLLLLLAISGAAIAKNIAGTGRSDYIVGTQRADTISGLSGNDEILGRNGNDRIYGGPGADLLYGGKGNDVLDGGPGDDRLYGGPGRNVFRCGPGNDTAFAHSGDVVSKDCEHVFGIAPPPAPPPPPPRAQAKPGHYSGRTADNEVWLFDITPDGLALSNLQTGQMNESCNPPDYYLSGGQISLKGPFPVAADGSFQINQTFSTTVGGSAGTDVLTVTGNVSSSGVATGTYREDTTFSANGTSYSCSTGNQTWTAAWAPQ